MNTKLLRTLTLTLTLTVAALPAAFGSMRYSSPNLPSSKQESLESSSCSADSNTIAVGVEAIIENGQYKIALLCADAGQLGFWTTPIRAAVVPSYYFLRAGRRLCQSGTALMGVNYYIVQEGMPDNFLLTCRALQPNLSNGQVTALGSSSSQFIQRIRSRPSLSTSLNPGAWLTYASNTIVTDPVPAGSQADLELAVRTVNENPVQERSHAHRFKAEIFNTGDAAEAATNLRLQLRFSQAGWTLRPLSANVSCSVLFATSSLGTLAMPVGQQCMPTGGTLDGRGGSFSAEFILEPNGPDTNRPIPASPTALVRVKAITANFVNTPVSSDQAAFPVNLIE